MSSFVPDESHQRWVSGVKLRMPRHIRNDSPADTPLVQCASWPLPSRWYEAHQEEIRRWRENKPHTIEEVMEIVRRELTVVHPLCFPARYTTIVEGRPVQAQRYNLILFSELILLAWSRHFREKVETCRDRVQSFSAFVRLSLGLRFR